jgi:hypothetical protein
VGLFAPTQEGALRMGRSAHRRAESHSEDAARRAWQDGSNVQLSGPPTTTASATAGALRCAAIRNRIDPLQWGEGEGLAAGAGGVPWFGSGLAALRAAAGMNPHVAGALHPDRAGGRTVWIMRVVRVLERDRLATDVAVNLGGVVHVVTISHGMWLSRDVG